MKPYPFIDERHLSVLTGVSKNKPVGGDQALADLYKLAKEIHADPVSSRKGFFISRMVLENGLIVAAATSEETGVYVQLSGKPGDKDNLVLTVGTKFSIEARDGTGNLATKTW